jgi:hypothetical protein
VQFLSVHTKHLIAAIFFLLACTVLCTKVFHKHNNVITYTCADDYFANTADCAICDYNLTEDSEFYFTTSFTFIKTFSSATIFCVAQSLKYTFHQNEHGRGPPALA